MSTATFKTPSLSRTKAMVGALLATLAIAGTVQTANPTPAHAAKSVKECNAMLSLIELADAIGLTGFGDYLWHRHNIQCSGAPH
jgi:hypothetical protein